jgi:pSer/pThr/pTyr-binding forkhead associated (FHA) protein
MPLARFRVSRYNVGPAFEGARVSAARPRRVEDEGASPGRSGPHCQDKTIPKDAHMITCERCHTENLDGSQYCDECGAILANQRRTAAPDDHAPRAPEENKDAGGGPEQGLPPDTRDSSKPADSVLRSQVIAPAAQTSAGLPKARVKTASAGVPAAPRAAGVSEGAGKSEGAHAKLVIDRGRSVGKEFLLNTDESHLGRWDADGGIFPDVDLDTDDPEAKVSRRHARITRRGGQYYIEDLGSTNGTFVNRGRRLLPGDRQPLRDGDEVIVGKTFLRFHVLG